LGKDILWDALIEFPSIQFGVEMAFQSLGSETLFYSFRRHLLVRKNQQLSMAWMGEPAFMKQQIEKNN
jgi:hypothetical protein